MVVSVWLTRGHVEHWQPRCKVLGTIYLGDGHHRRRSSSDNVQNLSTPIDTLF